MPTIKDIAKMAQVSTATVSRYLNNPLLVSESTRARILETIEKSGYLPNELARGLSKNSSRIIGVVMPDINNIFFPAVLLGVESELERNGYCTFICNTHNDIKKEKDYIRMMSSLRIAGVIFIGTRPIKKEENTQIFDLAETTPVLIINDFFKGHDISFVMTDETKGMSEVVRYLGELGHKRIALINGAPEHTTYMYKKKGFLEGCQQLGINNERYIINAQPYESGGYEAMSQLLRIDVGERPTAIVGANDQLAIGTMRAVFENGYTVPEDFSVVGFSNAPISGEIYPKLTTVDQFPYETGKLAASMMVSQIHSGNAKRNCMMDTKLVIRDSCAMLSSGA